MSALKYQKVITKEFTNRVTPSLVSMASVAVLSLWTAPGLAQESSAGGIEVAVAPEAVQASSQVEEILVTARRREESVQEVPIPISVVDDALLTQTGAFNVNRLKELIPTVQFYSTNPRNSAINIRGLGAPYGLTNDGLEPGVGLYVDGVFNARPAAATLDFIDVQQIEVLRGPQGTLYGKNTTAGAINVTTKKPSFTPETRFEQSFGNYGFIQSKASITGGLSDKLAARLSFAGTQRDGFLHNVATDDDLNDLNNLGFRGQLLYNASDDLQFILAGDLTRQRPEGYAQVYAGVAPTLRAPNRQYAAITADLGYTVPSTNPFDRLTDTDTAWRSRQDMGGISLTADYKTAIGQLTSITAWRFWNWDPSNDRDYLGLPITTISAAPSTQEQWTQEVRLTGDITPSLNYVVGVFGFYQNIKSDPVHVQEQGAAAARFLLNPGAAGYRADLLTGYGQNTKIDFDTESAALFGQLDWSITEKLHLLPGLRLNYDKKKMDFAATTYGGPANPTPAELALLRSVLSPQAYQANVDDTNVSGQLTFAYSFTDTINTYATYAKSYKSVGMNSAALPTDAAGNPALDAATVKPEDVNHYEVGIKTQPLPGVTANLSVFNTDIEDFQAQVQNNAVGALRGYLANAKKVRVRGVEFDSSARLGAFSLFANAAYTDGEYRSFKDAPAPLERSGGSDPLTQVVDASGTRLPGISKWAGSLGGEYVITGGLLGRAGDYYIGADASSRSDFSSAATESAYLNVGGYTLYNARAGFRANDGWEFSFWIRNLTDKDYFELLAAASGSTGLYVGQPGDPQTYGLTIRARF
jgi:iron complex outermembrane receptor protein